MRRFSLFVFSMTGKRDSYWDHSPHPASTTPAARWGATSATTSAWAHRQQQMRTDLPMSALQCRHVDFGRETVIFVDHSEDAVTLQLFELLVSDDEALCSSPRRTDVFLNSSEPRQEEKFRSGVLAQRDQLFNSSSHMLYAGRECRFVMTGSLANDPKLGHGTGKLCR